MNYHNMADRKKKKIKLKKIKLNLSDTGLDASKRAVPKAGELLGNEIADAVTLYLSQTMIILRNKNLRQ